MQNRPQNHLHQIGSRELQLALVEISRAGQKHHRDQGKLFRQFSYEPSGAAQFMRINAENGDSG
jgi:hypothetical protein